MVITLLSWVWIGICAFLCGFALLQSVFKRKQSKYWSADIYVMMGLCVLTVYAEVFSFFYKVAEAAVISLAVACLFLSIIFRKQLLDFCKTNFYKLDILKVIIILIAGLLVLMATVQVPEHPDTNLYHAQSIRWIEEYGIVKGLGNLYFRFAYNSSFFCLQALFSLKFLFGQSLHSMNGFIILVLTLYAGTSLNIFKKGKISTVDLLKLGLLVFVNMISAWEVSSSGSDILALSLVMYVCIKWSEYMQDGCRDAEDYGVICLLAVWAATVKLSAATLVLLACWPAVKLIFAKKWKSIALLLACGVIILLPLLVRNVIISGYLIYPYEKIDIFDVDWKMPAATVAGDSLEIKAWGRGLTSHELYHEPAEIWIPLWYSKLDLKYKPFIWLDLVSLAGVVAYIIWWFRKKEDALQMNLVLAALAGLITWFATAPLPRYGFVYMILLPILLIGVILKKVNLGRLGYMGTIAAMVMCFLYLTLRGIGTVPSIVWPDDYDDFEVVETKLEGITFYTPLPGGNVGYHHFPSAPNIEVLDNIELRIGGVEGGFRVKGEGE